MNQVDTEKKTALMKMFAIVGLLAVLVFGAWVAIRVVVLIPTAFSSLASLADGVYSYNTEPADISINLDQTVVASGELASLTWTDAKQPGTYYFVYECVDGVSVSLLSNGNEDVIACDDLFPLDGNALELRIESEKDRFTDVPLEILFVGDNAMERSAAAVVTTVNASIEATDIPEIVLSDTDEATEAGQGEVETDDTASDQEVVSEEEVDPIPEVAPETSVTIPDFEFITQIPISNPNGYTDLAIRYLGVGTIENNTFVFAPVIDNDDMGAIQFEVKNIGTKTSEDWTFEASLPNGLEYTSKKQTPLKPNERAILTVGFGTTDITGVKDFSVTVKTDTDLSSSNNTFEWAVEIVN